MQSYVVWGLIRLDVIPTYAFKDMIVAAPRVSYYIDTSMESYGGYEEVLCHEFVNGPAGNRIEALLR